MSDEPLTSDELSALRQFFNQRGELAQFQRIEPLVTVRSRR